MNYSEFVSANGITSNVALGLARLLDDPFFTVDPKNGSYGIAEVRQKAYDRFCRICLDASVPLPPLETELIDCHLPQNVSEKDQTEVQVLAEQITNRVHGEKQQEAQMCRAIGTMLLAFPNLNGYRNVNKASLVAMANRCLLKMGLEPIRPEYAALPNGTPATPSKSVKVLIVDDQSHDILKTAIALAGWPNVEVQWLHQKSDLGYQPPQEKKDAAVAELAQAIIDCCCDIVLMDQGLNNLDGHHVVRKARERAAGSMVFVANTSGDAKDLLNAGCVATADKGGRIVEAMQIAFRYLS